jgi:tetratricopeptide (TPR) repeat protein
LKLRVGAAYVMVHKPEEALKLLEDVLRERGGSAEANHFMGRARLEQGGGQMVNAMRFLKRAVELDPHRAEYHLYVAWAANESSPRQLRLASESVEKALALDKLLADGYWQRGIVRRYEKAVNDALIDLNHALELKPTRFEAYATIAECYQDRNEPEKALEAWQRAIAGNDRVARWRLSYGKLLLDRHRGKEALSHLAFAVAEMEKDSPRPGDLHIAEFLLAETLHKQGQAKESIRHYQAYLQFAPSSDPDRVDARAALAAMHAPEKPE